MLSLAAVCLMSSCDDEAPSALPIATDAAPADTTAPTSVTSTTSSSSTGAPTTSASAPTTSTSTTSTTSTTLAPPMAISRPYLDPAICTPIAARQLRFEDHTYEHVFWIRTDEPFAMQVVGDPARRANAPF